MNFFKIIHSIHYKTEIINSNIISDGHLFSVVRTTIHKNVYHKDISVYAVGLHSKTGL